MYFPIAKVSSVFAAINVVAANLHDNCHCRNGDSAYDRITTLACEAYNAAGYEWGGTTYNADTGSCVKATSEDKIAGKEWEAACRQIATSGFACADGEGTCYANSDDVRGDC
ncbi:hypothetical protein B0T10DRAFT_458343 [Thelonectria olida]|uniref:Uncharacterized protein n=1 Tax=Thelonectria olida TaxID=1576542 RepID=A0A9P9AUH7_9HYPO|nr:hypothetical protein B0T10DRAFT_458343 [Thelonectria olida]